MSPRSLPTIEDSLREMFPEEWLRQTAKETGLINVNVKLTLSSSFGF